ncbi:MAG: polyprenyl synthetase family protein [Proteobacteria bacterium]|nr:polyprenyl synthetase family protein [Pseudomonadota bacterium]MBU2226268.1 polyprenyl synthetase family protein [Pseudomonadota bacterium]MBU2261486.1 polyprenyl synthetase family protein [Pseudomonadota bacterium]
MKGYLAERKAVIDRALNGYLPGEGNDPPVLFEAVRYSLFAGGKRLRPILCLAAGEAVGGNSEALLPAACALELIHTYSLIHDDLPAMDNDDYRRGRLTSHKVFGEGIAILAGDALLTEAFRLLTRRELMPGIEPGRLLAVAGEIAEAAGGVGMVGGQALDVRSEGEQVDLETLHRIHRLKTGALIRVSLRAGAILAGASETELASLSDYGRQIGLAFQIADDILNVEGDRTSLGKETGSDAARGKVTFPALLGIDASRARAEALVIEALGSLASFGEKAEPLRAIARYITARDS